MAELREGGGGTEGTEKESRRMLIRLLYCYENPSGARHHVYQPVLPFSGCVSGGLSSFPRSSTTYCSTGVAAAVVAVATAVREGRGPTESRIPLGPPSPRKHHVRSYVRLTSADRPGLLLHTGIITAPRRISRVRRFREASRTRARSGRRFRCMGYPRRIAASMQFRALHTKLRTRGDADRSGEERRRGMDFIPRNVRPDSRQPPLLVKQIPCVSAGATRKDRFDPLTTFKSSRQF